MLVKGDSLLVELGGFGELGLGLRCLGGALLRLANEGQLGLLLSLLLSFILHNDLGMSFRLAIDSSRGLLVV